MGVEKVFRTFRTIAEKKRSRWVEEFLRKIVEDAGKALAERVLDYRVLVTARGDVEEVRLLLGYGGPNTELVVAEDYVYERVCHVIGCYELDYTKLVDEKLLREAFEALAEAVKPCA